MTSSYKLTLLYENGKKQVYTMERTSISTFRDSRKTIEVGDRIVSQSKMMYYPTFGIYLGIPKGNVSPLILTEYIYDHSIFTVTKCLHNAPSKASWKDSEVKPQFLKDAQRVEYYLKNNEDIIINISNFNRGSFNENS